ncbi:sugar ABC transporter substrate-binding protein [Streptomyces sp. SAJ15]|uniref:sugar ABC transporter substrate-binding protein n=1 Tax=Streptomyces sp. SAJ15 TaxID=2011095 RepID=UPI0021B41BF4|nr:substrate-binding domain-containing protein [Streptomyces sp. SAJ15]
MRSTGVRFPVRRPGLLAAAAALALALAGCGQAAQSGGAADAPPPEEDDRVTIGLLLPDSHTARWEAFDRPLMEKKIAELCHDCSVEYANAQGDVATQRQQVDTMITKGVDVMILDPVDHKSLRSSVKHAAEAGIPVVSYDRLADGPISAYVSFDGDDVGRLQGEALLKAMGDKADGGRIVMMNGDPSDPNAAWFRDGALSVLKDRVKVEKEYDTPRWSPENAHLNMNGAIAALGPDAIDGVYSANDALASGIISSLKAGNVKRLPPVTGQDAELTAVQRIVEGEQPMTVYKPFKPEAEAAAAMAVALGHGESAGDITRDRISTPTAKDVPAVLLKPLVVTVDNIKDTVVKDGMYTIDQICTEKFLAACEKAGLVT